MAKPAANHLVTKSLRYHIIMNNKTYTILQSFNKYEVNRLRKFLQSPYFNSNDAIVQLFEIFIKHIFSKKQKELAKEVIWKKIYNAKKYDDVRFRKLNSELLKLVEQFLAQQVYEDNPIYQASHLIEAVGGKKLEKLYNSTMKTARRLSDQQLYRPASFYFYQYQIEKNYYELTQLDIKRSAKGNEDIIAKNLDCFFLGEKLRLYCTMLSRQREAALMYNMTFINEIITHVKESDSYLDIPPVAVYYQICLSYIEPEEEAHYFNLKSLLSEHGLEFPQEEASQIYTYALNYCVRKLNRGKEKFLREYFLLYNDLLEKEIIFDKGELAPWHFKNIVLGSLRLGEYNWTEKFIADYNQYLPETFRENAITYNSAQLYFRQKKYDKVIRLLHQVEYEDLAYNLDSKVMLIIVYYETDEIEPLYSLFESFRVYLNRNKKIPQDRKKRYLNLIKFTKKLTKIIPGDTKTIEKLKAEIAATQGIINLNWLKEKIAELE